MGKHTARIPSEDFSEWLKSAYTTDPNPFGRLAARSLIVVAIRRRRWQGRAQIKKAAVAIDGVPVTKKNTTTPPKWRLLPDKVAAAFDSLNRSVDMLIDQYCINAVERRSESTPIRTADNPQPDDEVDDTPLVLRRGLYAVDAVNFEQVKRLMGQSRRRWLELADELCTEDGHAAMVEQIRERMGPELAESAVACVPGRMVLRSKFDLQLFRLPIRLDPGETNDPDEQEAAGAVAIEALEMVVRGPREKLATAASAFTDQLITVKGDTVSAFKPVKRVKVEVGQEEQVYEMARHIDKRAVTKMARALRDFAAFASFAEPELRKCVGLLQREVSEDPLTAAQISATLRESDETAVTVGQLAKQVLDQALSESGMCDAVQTRLKVD